jgi:PAS domain S-box-containing protein
MDAKAINSAEPAGRRETYHTHDAMLRWIRDIAPYGIFTTDRELVIRGWNEWLTSHSALSADEVVGRRLVDVFPDLAERRLDEHFQRALRGEISVLSTALHRYLLPLPNPVRAHPAEHMLQTARIAPLPEGDEIVGTVTIIEDVTQREYQAAILRRQQEYDRLLSESLAVLLRASNPIQTISEIFPRIAASLKLDVYFQYDYVRAERELRLQSASGVTAEVRRSLATVSVDSSLCGEVAARRSPVIESRLHLNPAARVQSTRRLGLRSYAGFPLQIGDRVMGVLSFGSYARETIATDEVEFLGKLAQYLAIAIDRAQRDEALHDAQQRLSEHASDLELKVAERTARLHETIVQLESFSYTIAHDLRAPIRSLTSFTEILLSDFRTGMPAPALELIERLHRASRRLDSLTRDLLKFARIVREDVQLSPIDLDTLVSDILADQVALREKVDVVRPLGRALVQTTLVRQCFANLFDNAQKFSRPGVPLRIRIFSELRSGTSSEDVSSAPVPLISPTSQPPPLSAGPRLRVSIEDNGVGIPAEAYHKIWGVFERLPTAKSVEGTGIGLAIVARAMQQMRGSCGVESQPGRGSRFWLEFERAE